MNSYPDYFGTVKKYLSKLYTTLFKTIVTKRLKTENRRDIKYFEVTSTTVAVDAVYLIWIWRQVTGAIN